MNVFIKTESLIIIIAPNKLITLNQMFLSYALLSIFRHLRTDLLNRLDTDSALLKKKCSLFANYSYPSLMCYIAICDSQIMQRCFASDN